MKIVVNFNHETKECEVQWERDEEETTPLWDAMPYVYDALYAENRKEMKKHMLR